MFHNLYDMPRCETIRRREVEGVYVIDGHRVSMKKKKYQILGIQG
jgi:hypothetical protein